MAPILALTVVIIVTFSFVAVTVWSISRRREREAYHRSETIKRIAEAQTDAGNSALEFIRAEERNATRRRGESLKLGGISTVAVSNGMTIFLRAISHGDPVSMMDIIPMLIGAALLTYAYVLAPKQ